MDAVRCKRFVLGAIVGSALAACLLAPAFAQMPTESDVFVDRGILAYDSRDYQEALRSFQEALRLSPNNVNALYYTGLTYMALEQWAPAQAALEQAQRLAPTDPDVAFQLGVVYFLQQQFDKAEPVFRQVYASQPQRPNLGYYLGVIEYRKQYYQEAVRFLRAAVPSDENFAQLIRFYSGLALSALGFAGQARDEIEESLRLQPASPLATPAARFRDVLGPAAQAERNFHVDLKVGFYYDDNVAVVPNGGTADLAAQVARDADHRSFGELGYLRFEYMPLRTPDWEGTFAGSVLQTLNNDVSGYNTTNLTGLGSLVYKTRLWNMPAAVGGFLQYDYIALSGSNYLNQYSIPLFMSLAWDTVNLTTGQVRVQFHDFMDQDLTTPDDDRDGIVPMAGITHFFRFQGDRHHIKLGYQLDRDFAKGNNWDYLGHRFLVGFQYTLPWWDIRLRYDFDAHLRDYRNLHSYLPLESPATIHRTDRQFLNLVSLAKDFPHNLTVALEYLRDDNISNLPLYDYSRNVISINVSWRY